MRPRVYKYNTKVENNPETASEMMTKPYRYGRVAPREETGRPAEDIPAKGGDKNEVLPEVTPFVSDVVSDASISELRVSLENQLRQISDVTRSFVISLKSLDERLKKLEKP